MDASIDAREDRLVRFRRRLHATPEPSGHEVAITALVAETLRQNRLEPHVLADDIGVFVDIDLGAPAETRIALRCELDCVQVNDDKQVAYASNRPGLCHACGHDAHTTIVIAAAAAMNENLDHLRAHRFRHNLRFVFQPAEETGAGARSMISQGVIDAVEAILAVHVDPFLDVGRVGVRKGALTSAAKGFRIAVRGRSGHSARPFEAIDPIPAAVNIVSLFYQLCPRSLDSRHPLALTVASIDSGNSFNAIPDEAVIRGTLRTTRMQDTDIVQQRMERIIAGVAEATGTEISMEFVSHSPATDNDGELIDTMAGCAESLLGPASVDWLELPSLGAEDFGFYQELIPGAVVRLGAAATDGRPRRPLHSSLFDIDERALAIGSKFLLRSALATAATWSRRMA